MYNYHEMERRYDEYRKKTILRWIYPITSISMVLLAGSMYFALTSYNDIKNDANKTKEAVSPQKNSQKEQLELKLQESVSTQPPSSAPQTQAQIAPRQTGKEVVVTPTVSAATPAQVSVSTPTKPGAVLIQSKADNTGSTLEDKFVSKPDAALAIRIANDYFSKHDYKSSANWAMKANELDSKSEESWIIFARSLNRQGKKTDAMRALEGYLHQNDSPAAREWLSKIKNGNSQ